MRSSINLKIIMFFSMIILFNIYMFIYLLNLEYKEHNFYFLAATLLFGLISLFLNSKNINIKKSFWFLSIFLIYLLLNTILTNKEYIFFVIYVIVFFIIGSCITINLFSIKNIFLDKNQKRLFFILFFSYSIFLIASLSFSYIQLIPKLDAWWYFVQTENAYQVGGYFLSIICLIYSVLFLFILIFKKYQTKIVLITTIILYFLIVISSIFLSQIIGSNIGFVNILGLLLSTCVMYLLSNFKVFLETSKFKLKEIFNINFLKRILFSIILSCLFIFLTFFSIINLLDLDIKKFRIFIVPIDKIEEKQNIIQKNNENISMNKLIEDLKQNVPSSISSRIELLYNFKIQFKENPIFGNMKVDVLTTGAGTYTHSFILSMLSHIGLFGFTLFIIYLYYSFKEFFKFNVNDFNFENLWTLYFLMVFAGLFLISVVGTFFVYMVIWFLFGMIFPPIELKNNANKNISIKTI